MTQPTLEMTQPTLERFADNMAADDVLAGARFEAMTEEDHAAALERAVKVINRKHARTPQSAEDLHIFPAVMSTDAVDSHFSRMDDSTLKNYSKDAGDGVPFMNSHRTGGFPGSELPLGHTYEGTYEDGSAAGGTGLGARKVAKAGIYMLRSHRPNGDAGVTTDDMMRGIDAGTTRDGSVGFYGGKSVCDICGSDVRDSAACPHIPGTSRKTENGKIATYTVQGAHLREFSGVFAGSTPGAMFSRSALDKTERAIVDKLIGSQEVSYLEDHYRLALTGSRTHYSFAGKENDSQGREETHMNAKNALDAVIVRVGPKLSEDVRKALETARGTMDDASTDAEPILAAFERTVEIGKADADLLAQFRAAGVATADEARALKADGEDGRAYRKDLIEDALKAGVRAQGEHFSKSVYENILKDQARSVADIKTMRDDWDKAAQKRMAGFDKDGNPLEGGGRQTTPLTGFESINAPAAAKRPGSNRGFQAKK